MSQVLCKTEENIYWLKFVKNGQNFKSTSSFDLCGKKVIDTCWLCSEYYNGYPSNEHHLTTDFYYNVLLPFIKLYIEDFNFNINDFCKVNRITKINGRIYDMSYIEPKDKSMLFTMSKNGVDLFENKPFSYLHYCDGNFDDELPDDVTEYHKIFRGFHSCCKITNNVISNNKTIFVTGDSMSIPLIPILCCYFKEVVYMDNRDGISHKEYYEGKVFDDVVIQLWEGHPIYKPLELNLI